MNPETQNPAPAPTPPTNPQPTPAPTPTPAPAPQPPTNASAPDASQAIHNPLAVMQPGETNLFEIKRHPIGLLGIYVMTGVVLTVAAIACLGLGPSYATSISHDRAVMIGLGIFLFIAFFGGIFALISTVVYWGNRWVLSSDSLTQITQTSLFSKQSSQLSLGNVEDVTAEQNGILTHIFNYGVLKVETAGEHSKFNFLYCPNPNTYAQKLLTAREQFEQGRRAEMGGFQQPTGSPATYSPPTTTTQS